MITNAQPFLGRPFPEVVLQQRGPLPSERQMLEDGSDV